MAQVTLHVGGRRYDLACRTGEEAHLEALARVVDEKAQVAAQALGPVNEARQLLLAALLLADQIGDASAPTAPISAPGPALFQLASFADRLEAIADRLEKDADAA